MTLSTGLVEYRPGGAAHETVRLADEVMYRPRRSGELIVAHVT
ncbi:MAG: hypothetical protein ACE5JS_21005 [Nitrospinota bacterium]